MKRLILKKIVAYKKYGKTRLGISMRNPFSVVSLFVYAIVFVTVLAAGFDAVMPAKATITKTINFQGKLTNNDASGTNVANGTYTFEFKMYTASAGGVAVWTETWDGAPAECPQLTVTNGVFNAKLGSCNTTFPDFTGGSMYISVNFNPGAGFDGEMTPRKQIGSTVYAILANGVNGDGTVQNTVSSTTALTVAKAGTDYALQVDTSTASAVTGLKVTSAAAAGGLALAVISSGTDESLTLNAKGAGTVSINGTATGDILFGGGSGATGCTVTNSTGALACTSTIASGVAGGTIGGLLVSGNTSGTVSILPQAAAGTYNFNLPTTAGNSGEILTSAGGVASPMTWTAPDALAVRWNSLVDPTGTQTLAFGDAELNAWTVSSDTETFHTITANSLTTGILNSYIANGLTTGELLNLSHTTSVIADGGSLIKASSTSIDTGGATQGVLLDLSSTASLAGTQFLQTYSGLTTGIGEKIVTNALTTGTAFIIPHTTSVIANGGSLARLSSTSVDTSTTTGTLLDLQSSGSTAGTIAMITNNTAAFTGISQSISMTGQTSGTGLSITGGGANLTAGGELIDLQMGAATVGSGLNITTTGAYTGAGILQLTANTATTGTLEAISSSSLTSGKLLDLTITGTGGLTNQKGINVSLSGANGTGAQTTYGGYFSNTHTGTSNNVGLYATASGGTNNYAAIFENGQVGIGTTAPSVEKLEVVGNIISKGTEWTARTDTGSIWQSVAYGNGLFVAVRYAATATDIMTSPDGINWTARTDTGSNWTSVAYGNGLFVAVSDTATATDIMTSPDGINWTARTDTGSNWTSVAYGNGLFVAVSQASTATDIMTSPDGITWTPQTDTGSSWTSVAYGNGLFVAVNNAITATDIMTSPDGITWTPQTDTGSSWRSVTYGNGLFVAVSGGSTATDIMTSPDGITWTARTDTGSNWGSVTYGNGLFVAVSQASTATDIMTSPDGITWTARTDTGSSWTSVAYGNGLFVAVSQATTATDVMTSGKTDYIPFSANNIYQGGMSVYGTLQNTGHATTLASAAGAEYTTGTFTSPTITLTGTTQVTSTMDSFLFNQPTITDASAVIVDKASTLTIAGAPISAGSVTLTDSYGLKINAASVTAATRATSLFIDAPTGATNNYAAVFNTGSVGIGTTGPDRSLDVLNASAPQIRLTTTDGTVYGDMQNTANANLILNGSTLASSSALQYGMQINPTINQTSSAGYTGLLINSTETALGTGDNNLLDLQVAASSKLAVRNDGSVTLQDASYITTPFGGFGRFENLMLRSEQFDNASWVKTANTTVPNTARTAPDGSTTADEVQFAANAATDDISQTSGVAAVSNTFTVSVWLKFTGATTVRIGMRGTGGTPETSNKSVSVTTGWQRFSYTKTFTAGATGNAEFFIDDAANASAVNVYAWGAQMEKASKASVYAKTTTAALSNNSSRGLIVNNNMLNTTASGFLYGERHVNVIDSTTAGTHIGQFIRMVDNTSLDTGQTVQGLQVQAYSGANVNGTNTGIATFGYTFGIQATTTAQAAAQAAPAAIFADLDNGTDATTKARGNAIRAYTDNATSADLVYLYQETSAYTGNGLLMDFGNGGGSFSSGNFINLKNAGTSKLTVASTGRVDLFAADASNIIPLYINSEESTVTQSLFAIESDTVANGQSVDTVKAHFEADGSLFVSLPGTATTIALCHASAGLANNDEIVDCSGAPSDVAEYFGSEDPTLAPGEVVVVGKAAEQTYIDGYHTSKAWVARSSKPYQSTIIGVVSTAPAIAYGDEIFSASQNPRPVALTGRVPVKVNNENGPIEVGDFLTASSTPGVAMRASKVGPVLGQALENFDGTTSFGGTTSSAGTITAFINISNYNGAAIENELPGLVFDYSGTELGDVEQAAQTSYDILAHLLEQLPTLDPNNLSQIRTDVVIAGGEVVTPTVTANSLRVDLLSAATADGALSVASNTVFNGGLLVDSIGSIGTMLSIQSDVEFFGIPYFTTDTAGFAIIQTGAQSVDIEFTSEYLAQPIINATISFESDINYDLINDPNDIEDLKNAAVSTTQNFLQSGVSYAITNKTTRGFTIVLNKPAPSEVKFSWISLAVKNANTFMSLDAPDSGAPGGSNGDGSEANGSPDSGFVAGDSTPENSPPPSDIPPDSTPPPTSSGDLGSSSP